MKDSSGTSLVPTPLTTTIWTVQAVVAVPVIVALISMQMVRRIKCALYFSRRRLLLKIDHQVVCGRIKRLDSNNLKQVQWKILRQVEGRITSGPKSKATGSPQLPTLSDIFQQIRVGNSLMRTIGQIGI